MIAVGIVIAAGAAVVISAVWYGAMSDAAGDASAPQRSMVEVAAVESVRNLAVASLIAGLLAAGSWEGLGAGLLVGVALWTIPVVLLAGSVFHEGVATRRAALHGVDWLLKLGVIGAILGPFS